jgi:hypothetical protein
MCKRSILVFAVVLGLASCKNLVTDLPKTDYNKYISGATVEFPKGTAAIDIYNTIVQLYPNQNQYYSAAGNLEYTRIPINNKEIKGIENPTGIDENPNGLLAATKESRSFDQIKHAHTSYAPEVNEHAVYFSCPATTITLTNGTKVPVLKAEVKIVFKWQRQTTNVWQNDEIGKSPCIMTVEMKNNSVPYNLNITATPIKITFPKP